MEILRARAKCAHARAPVYRCACVGTERECRGKEREAGKPPSVQHFVRARGCACLCMYVYTDTSANRDPSSNGVQPIAASDCAPASARHRHRRMRPIVVNGGVKTESAVLATRSSAFSFVVARSRIRLCFVSVSIRTSLSGA